MAKHKTKVRFQVVTEPPGAALFLDDKDTGMRTPASPVVGSGGHSIRLELDGHITRTAKVDVRRKGLSFTFPLSRKLRGGKEEVVGLKTLLYGGMPRFKGEKFAMSGDDVDGRVKRGEVVRVSDIEPEAAAPPEAAPEPEQQS